MKQIQIINGIYGHRDGGRITPVQAGTVISVPDDEALRLIQMGIAIAVQTQDNDTIDISDGHFTEESLMQMTKAELAELAADLGTDISGCKNKTEIVAVLLEVEIPPQEDAPELGAEDPVL